MAWIKRNGARKELARDIPTISVSNFTGDGGLRFNVEIGGIKASFTHMERDVLIAKWDEQQKQHEA